MTDEAKILKQMNASYKSRIRFMQAKIKAAKCAADAKASAELAVAALETECAYMEGALEGLAKYASMKD